MHTQPCPTDNVRHTHVCYYPQSSRNRWMSCLERGYWGRLKRLDSSTLCWLIGQVEGPGSFETLSTRLSGEPSAPGSPPPRHTYRV
eukprot:365027-Chlamydomonas_euryale.AAC.2